MARKETITISTILSTAFDMTREEGFANVTARKVANRAGCSTQPIFRVYENMEELCTDVYRKTAEFFLDFFSLYPRTGKAPFVNLGMAYIAFAREEPHLFQLLFLTEVKQKFGMYELLNGSAGNVVMEINAATEQGCKNPEDLFMKMWIFIHGAACMTLTGDYDLFDAQTMELLTQSYYAYAGLTDTGATYE